MEDNASEQQNDNQPKTFKQVYDEISQQLNSLDLNNTQEGEYTAMINAKCSELSSALTKEASCLNLEGGYTSIFTNQNNFNILASHLNSKYNISIERDEQNENICFKIGINNVFEYKGKLAKDERGNQFISGTLSTTSQEQKTQDPQGNKKKKNKLLPIILILLAIIIVGAIIAVLIWKNKQDQDKKDQITDNTDKARNDLQSGEKVDIGEEKGGGTHKIDPNQGYKNADGTEKKISEVTTYNEGDLSDIAKKAINIENNPNGNYRINGRLVIGPQVDYKGLTKVIKFFDTNTGVEKEMNVSEIKSFTQGVNNEVVDSKTIDAMASYTRNSDGTISFKYTDGIVQFDKDNNNKMTYSLYTDDGTLLSTYSRENVFERDGKYGYIDNNNTEILFSENIQDAVGTAFRQIKTKYPDYDLSSVINQLSNTKS